MSNGLCPNKQLWYNDDGNLVLNDTVIIDEYTIKFVLNKNWKDFVMLQDFPGCRLIKPHPEKQNASIGENETKFLVGTGPFRFYSINETTQEVILLANNDYYRGAPDIQKLNFKTYEDSIAYNEALIQETCHVIWSAAPQYFDSFAVYRPRNLPAGIDLECFRRAHTNAFCFFD